MQHLFLHQISACLRETRRLSALSDLLPITVIVIKKTIMKGCDSRNTGRQATLITTGPFRTPNPAAAVALDNVQLITLNTQTVYNGAHKQYKAAHLQTEMSPDLPGNSEEENHRAICEGVKKYCIMNILSLRSNLSPPNILQLHHLPAKLFKAPGLSQVKYQHASICTAIESSS